MKLKPLTVITLAVALATGAWLWFHHPSPPAHPAAPSVSRLVKPDLAALPPPVPNSAPKLQTITPQPAAPEIQSPAPSDWSAVHKIVNDRLGYEVRLSAVSSLSTHLSDVDWAVLRPFLLKPDAADRLQLGQVLKNALMDALCALNPPPADLGDVFTKIYRDKQQDEVIRDYAVQHLGAYYEQLAALPNSAKAGQAVQKVLWEAVQETDGSIGGTALLALKRLSEEFTGFDQAKIAATALQMAGDNNAGELTHITAFQVCARMKTADALPVVLQAAENGESIPVKMSAIGALGQLGGADQIPFLNGVLQGEEERLKPAAKRALAQITTAQNPVASQN